jgi:hypothetical protein
MGCCFGKQESAAPTLKKTVKWSSMKGPECKASSFVVSGVGSVLANCPIEQTKSYFEVKVVENGSFCVGVSTRSENDLHLQLVDRPNTWCLQVSPDDGKTGDVIGIAFDLSEVRYTLTFYRNGVEIPQKKISGIKGEVCAAASVANGALLEANFGQAPFLFSPPNGYILMDSCAACFHVCIIAYF